MAVDAQILELLACPETHAPLRVAEATLLAQVNARIAAGDLKTRAGTAVIAPLEEALVRADGKCLYRVDDGIPNLLIDDRIEL